MSLDTVSHAFFGVGGVLLAPVPGPVEAVETLLFAHRRIRSTDVIRTALDRVLAASPHPGWSPEDRDTAARLFRELALEEEAESLARMLCDSDRSKWVIAPGAIAALELLRRKGIPAGGISSIGETQQKTLEAVGLRTYLERIFPVPESPSEQRDAEQLRISLIEDDVDLGTACFICAASDPALERVHRAGLRVVPIAPEPGKKGIGWPYEWRTRRADEAVHHLLDGRG